MSKKTIPQLKEYFKAAKRPTEGQFGDLLDSYVHLDATTYYRESNDFKFTFPNQQADQAVDILLGNTYVNGWLEVEIAGFYNHQNSVGSIKKLLVVGANADNGIWFPSVSRIVEASGEIVNHIYIGEVVWDSSLNQYKITVYHTNSNGNDYALRLIHHSAVKSVAHEITLSSVYTRPLTGQQKHYVNYNDNLGIGTKNPRSRLQVISPASTPDQYGAFSLGEESSPNLRMGYNGQYTWIQSHSGAPIQINPIGNSTILNRDGGNVGVGINAPQSKLDVNGFVTATMTDSSINSTNRVGFNISELGNNVFEMSYPRNGFGTAEIKTIGARHLSIGTDNTKRIHIDGATGYVGIGTQNPDQKLTVKGNIHAEDIIINANVPADYVFEKYYDNYSATREDYSMMNLDELESFIRENKHLPEIPSGNQMTQNGVTVGDFQMKLLQKIEELTLYMIAQNKELEHLKSQINNTNA